MNFNELRKKHQQFIYEGFEVKEENGDVRISFDFLITPEIHFKPEIIFPNIKWDPKFNNLVFNLGLVEMLSYWKATCSPEIIIKAGYLNDEQIAWWKDLLIKGLGEFFYKNKIDFTQPDLVKFKISHLGSGIAFPHGELKDKNLILVGGGKDSAVTLESFNGKENNCLMLNPTEAAKNITKVAGFSNPIIIKRTIDPKLLELNEQGYLNGHTPFSAYLAFVSTMAAILYDYKNIVVSNEASSNEGNVEFHGKIINHQYSKSLEFEEKYLND